VALGDQPFSYRRAKDDRVMIDWNGRRAAVLTGARARRFLAAVEGAGPERAQLEMKRYDLMQDINCRGTFLVSRTCVPHLRQAENPHILTLSPPISLERKWLGGHIGYTIAKYGMSLAALGVAEAVREAGIASNTLWPRTLIATAAVQNLLGGDAAMARSRRPEIYADAAYAVITRPSRECTGNMYLCEDVLVEEGVTDFDQYMYVSGGQPQVDLYVDDVDPPAVRA
jgi:citronellol/citronellal dehydrogenase